MEAQSLKIFKFRRNASIGADVISEEETDKNDDDDDNEFFDLVFIKSPDRVAVRRFDEAATKKKKKKKKDDRSVESPRFRVLFMFGFRRSSKSTAIDEANRFSVDRGGENTLRSQLMKEDADHEASLPEKSPYAVSKYVKMIKPLYLRVWRRRDEKARLTDALTPSSPSVSLSPSDGGSRFARFKVAAKRLGKSRSTSAAAGAAAVRRRDDSLVEQLDGIQGAVMYCKKSYNSSSKEISQLFRSSSDPSREKLGHQGSHSCEEPTRCSI